MLSILIPIYNFPAFKLVRELVTQALEAQIPHEIICINDASFRYLEENRAIMDLPNTIYMDLTENLGRSRVRNLLVSKAHYEALLFLDCDSKIAKTDFLITYMEAFRYHPILSGGTLYDPLPPSHLNYLLHWTVGSIREPNPDDLQRKIFTSNNYMIKKSIIEQYPFNETVVRYGHEDTLLQMELEKQGLNIRFISNPVIHIGLETNRHFIEKTQESILNLYELYTRGVFDGLNTDRIRLLTVWLHLKKWKMDVLYMLFFPLIHRLNEKTNAIGKPNLWIFDLYKLAFLCLISRKKHEFAKKNRESLQITNESYCEY
jgi:glycosyltransferase involved in cell wall biosynthesis